MEDIKDLFIKIYGKTPTDDDSIELFLENLDRRLSYREKLYLYEQYGVDLIDQEEIENHIIRLMKHPAIFNQLTK